uniref:Dynein axonemal light chain 1 n=1 Tax=Culicoides sonorensis TaxID=179676 RepID=A0A336LY00_CULSO
MDSRKLSLSTNNIDKIAGISGMKNLKILALGRNNIKFLTGLDAVAETLEQLWISYNLIEKLNGIEKLQKLKIFYASNNKIKDWTEVARLGNLPLLEDLLLKGNPIKRDDMDMEVYKREVIKRVPTLQILDGEFVAGYEDEDENDDDGDEGENKED